MNRFMKNIIPIAIMSLTFLSGGVYAQISGHLTVCRGASRTTLTGTPSGGTWASGDVTKATINSSTGEVTGVAAGTATISYTDPSSTVHTAVVTVNGYVMGNIGFSMGTDIRCTGGVPSTCTVSPLIGNNWTSSDPSIATINTGGSVVPSATNAGTVTISYRHAYGNCYVTRGMTVNPTPTVSIINPVCAGVTQTATGTPTGGTWMSSNNSVGTINTTTGVLSSFIGGGTYIRYTVGGCYIQPFLTVSAGVAAFGGSTTVCVGNTSTLTCASSGGTWSSTDPSVATIGSSTGVVTGVSLGTTTISYIIGSSCFRTAVVTVNAGPSASAGPDEVCQGQAIALTNATGGGTWSSSSTARATVTTYGGTVTGVSAGTVNISYRVGSGCASVKTIIVNAAMAAIAGGPNVCEGSSVTLTHAMGSGTWTASNSHATVDLTTGVMTGVTAGSVNITYTASPGCKKGQMMIVKPAPAAITGELTVCPGATTALSSASGGGTWSSSDPSVVTVSSYGVVSGIAGGTAMITYTVASWGCSATAVVTVSSTGGSISGSTTLYPGLTTTFTSSASGGIWISSNTDVATVGSSTGVVSAIAAGAATITYTLGSCTPATLVVTVLSTPAPISGGLGLEVGDDDTLANPVASGIWSSSNTSVATIGSLNGIVTAVAPGTSVISYTVGSTYLVTAVVTVSASSSSSSTWVTYCGGSEYEELYNTAVDDSGNVYIVGVTSSDGLSTVGSYQETRGGDVDVYIQKYTSNGSLLWSTYFGGSNTEYIYGRQAIDIDDSGYLYIVGGTLSSTGIASTGAFQETPGKGFVAKFRWDGQKEWSTYFGGVSESLLSSVIADDSGNFYLGGFVSEVDVEGSDTGIATPGAFQEVNNGGMDIFLVKFDGNCERLWGTYFGGGSWDHFEAFMTDQSGNIIVGGSSGSEGIATSGAPQTMLSGASDCFIVKFSASGARLWCSYFGGENDDVDAGIGIGQSGNIYLTGLTSSATGIATAGAHKTSLSVGGWAYDLFIAKLDSVGHKVWCTYFGGSGVESGMPVIDEQENVYLSGYAYSDTGIASPGASQTVLSGASDAFIAKFDSSGVRKWSTYFGSAGDEYVGRVALAPGGYFYVAGGTSSSSGITTANACDSSYGGNSDGFLAKFVDTGASAKPVIHKRVGFDGTFVVYPNPTGGFVSIYSEIEGKLDLYAIDGRIILTQTVEKGATAIGLPTSAAAGIYLLRFTGENGAVQTVKLIYQP
jgi:uncharacterized protein YjdB